MLHALLPRVHQGQLSSLAVCSAETGEGRSHLSLYIGEAASDHLGAKVLLVDADSVRPSLHRELGIDSPLGFTDVLRGNAALPDAVRPTLHDGLDVLCASRDLPMNSEDVTRERLEPFLETCRQAYRMTVFDTGPLLASQEASQICHHATGVLLVVLAGVTQGESVARAHRVLLRAHAALLGVVVNDPRDEFQRDES